MCLTTSPIQKPNTVVWNNKHHLLAWKDFSTEQGEIRGAIFDSVPYRITKVEDDFLLVEERFKATQELNISFINKKGITFHGTSSRLVPIGMHVSLFYSSNSPHEPPDVPVLIPPHNIILFGDFMEATVDALLIPTPKWASENLNLDEGQVEELAKLMNLYVEEK